MKGRDLLRLVLSNLLRMKARVTMTAAGVLIGTAAIMILISLGAGLQKSVTDSLGAIGELTELRVWPSYDEQVRRMGAGRVVSVVQMDESQGITEDELREIRALPGVTAATPLVWLQGGAALTLHRYQSWANIQGIDADAIEGLGFELRSGDLTLGSGAALVGARVSDNFYDPRRGLPPDEPIDLEGQTLRLTLQRWVEDGQVIERPMRLRVAGVLAETGGERDYTVYIRLSDVTEMNTWFTGQRPNYNRDGYPQLLVKARSPEVAAALEQELTGRGYMVYSPLSMLRGINQTFLIIQAVLGGIGGVALLVAAFGIANTMIMAIYERTREIGLMKAVGANNLDVMSIFLAESGFIGLLGGLGGVGVGLLVGRVIALIAAGLMAQQGNDGYGGGPFGMGGTSLVHTPLWLPIFSILFAGLIGVLSGVYPALRAARLDPIAALRSE